MEQASDQRRLKNLLIEIKSVSGQLEDLYREERNRTWLGRNAEVMIATMATSGVGMVIFFWLFIVPGKQSLDSWYFYGLCACAFLGMSLAVILSWSKAQINSKFAKKFPLEYKVLKKLNKVP